MYEPQQGLHARLIPKVLSKMASLWDAIDDELYRLPPELKDPRFDSLRHVLSIVSSVNAESSVDEVRQIVSWDPCLRRLTDYSCTLVTQTAAVYESHPHKYAEQ